MPSRQKAKGNKFENDIVDFLNKTYNTTEFHRTPNSGAMMGRTNWGKNQGLSENVRRTLGSDLIVPDWFKFSVECKHYKDDPNYSQIIKGPDTKLNHWLAECVFDAINMNLHPLLFFKTNRQGIHFALPAYFSNAIKSQLYEHRLNTNYHLRYDIFVISGVDTFERQAETIKECAQAPAFDHQRTEFFSSENLKPYLKILEDENENTRSTRGTETSPDDSNRSEE